MSNEKPEFKPEEMSLDQLFAEMIEQAKAQKVLEFLPLVVRPDDTKFRQRSEEVSSKLIACMAEIRRRVRD